MSCGAPIVCSDTTAMPETCAGAALYFDPYNIEQMSEKKNILLSDHKLKKLYSEKSLKRVKELPDFHEVTAKTIDIMKNI